MKKAVKEGDYVKHKTISWMNRGKPFHVISVENGKVYCEYTGKDDITNFYEFDVEQLVIVPNAGHDL